MDCLLITAKFPYGTRETFLENEVKALSDAFETVYIYPIEDVSKEARPVRCTEYENVRIIPSRCKRLSKPRFLMRIPLLLFKHYFWSELHDVIVNKQFSLANLRQLLLITVYTYQNPQWIYDSFLSMSRPMDRELVIYSYWLYDTALTAALLKSKLNAQTVVSRAHGHDVYEERHGGYLAYRRFLLEQMDKVFCISLDGKKHIIHNYPEFQEKIKVARLGTRDYGVQRVGQNDVFQIVSCSNCIPLKRIDRIIEALSAFTKGNRQINWIHYGSGPLLEQLEASAFEKLSDQVSFVFAGQVSNTELMKHYQEMHVDLFLNVSETEGIPVSIMEALSFGIPVIATAVGGTSECVFDGVNGFLLEKDFQKHDLTRLIGRIMQQDEKRQAEMRSNARLCWERDYSADDNYKQFVQELLKE